jgi:hypothetical protein
MLKIIGKFIGSLFCAIFAIFLILEFIYIYKGLTFQPSLAYFDAFLNYKYEGYKKYEGRVIKCDSWEEDKSEYEVNCQYFRGSTGEEQTYHAFDRWGGYIGSRDGG